MEYSTENKVLQFFKKIVKKNFFSNYEIIYYIKKNLGTIKSNFTTYIQRVRKIQKDIYFTGMIYGNYKEEDLEFITDKLEKYIGDIKEKKFRSKKFKITAKGKRNIMKLTNSLHNHILVTRPYIYRGALNNNPHYTFNKNVIGNFYQIGKRDLRNNLMMTMIEMIWGNLFKLNLGKKEKNKVIANVISTSKKIIDNNMYYIFIIESHNNLPPSRLNNELDKILDKLMERIENLDLKKLDKFREYIRGELKLEDANLNERSSRAWNEIYENTHEFYYKERLLDELDKITQRDLMEFAKLNFISQPKKLSVQLYGNQKELITNTLNILEESYGMLNNKLKVMVKIDQNFLKNKRMLIK